MGSLVLTGDTSGSVTVAVPAVAGTNTVTIPAATGTVMVSGNMPAFSAYVGTSQSVTTSTSNKIQFSTKLFDTGTCFNNTGSTVTLNGISVPAYSFAPNVAGYYQVSASLDASGSASITRYQLNLFKNGTGYVNFFDANSSTYAICGSNLIYLNGTSDYISIYAYITATSPVYSAGVPYSLFSACLVRGA
jgi:hypothetical protein